MFEIRQREVPELLVVTEERTVNQAELVEWLPGAMGRVARAADGVGGIAKTTAMPWLLRDGPGESVFIVIYEGNPNEGPVPVEVCAPIDGGRSDTGDVPSRRVPAHREAYVRLTRAQTEPATLGSAYAEVERWIGAQGLDVAAAPREVYYRDYFSAGPDDEVFDVAWPIR
ncbi:MAG TPA: GyrI-like domain-containing protein [Candidatus Dormibacteraeota bacterium]|nr:GyrI-like domain-containing protein [Candidatus Dormibacteraeota bacterium]